MTGQFVISKAGHDKGTIYMIVAEEEEFVYLSDGQLKTQENPKKKNRKHVQPINRMADSGLCEKLNDGRAVRPEEIRYAIRQYSENQVSKM